MLAAVTVVAAALLAGYAIGLERAPTPAPVPPMFELQPFDGDPRPWRDPLPEWCDDLDPRLWRPPQVGCPGFDIVPLAKG